MTDFEKALLEELKTLNRNVSKLVEEVIKCGEGA